VKSSVFDKRGKGHSSPFTLQMQLSPLSKSLAFCVPKFRLVAVDATHRRLTSREETRLFKMVGGTSAAAVRFLPRNIREGACQKFLGTCLLLETAPSRVYIKSISTAANWWLI